MDVDNFKLTDLEIEAEIYYLTEGEGGRKTPVGNGYCGQFLYNSKDWDIKGLILFLTLSFALAGCMSSEFILTGQIHETLPIDYPVKVILPGSRQNLEYEDIGILRVKQSDMDNLSKAVELAKKEARLKGGDIVILSSSDTKTSVSGNTYGVYSSERNSFMFIIGKLKQ